MEKEKIDKFAYSLDEERYYSADCVADILENGGNNEEACIYVGEKVQFAHKDFIFATDVLWEAKERAYNEVGEWCEGYLDSIPKEKLEQLNELVLKWFDENVKQPTYFTVKNVKKITVEEFKSGDINGLPRETIEKYGKSIAIHTKKRIQYTKGDILGNNITFIEEVKPDTRLKSKSSNKLVNFRRALFRCYCGKKFSTRIDLIKMQKIKSCGCLQIEKLNEYHKRRELKNEA